MAYGNEHTKRKFTVLPGNPDDKKCFKDDCRNEGEACRTCQMIQGRWINYQQADKLKG